MTKATLAQARHWLLQLGTGQPEFNGKNPKETELVIRPLAASLIKTYEADVFCEGSRESVSTTLKWFREADIRERLDTWCSLNIRDAMALPIEAETAPFDREGKFWVASFYNAKTDTAAERALDLIQSKHQPVYRWLTNKEDRAANIAVTRRWFADPTRDDLADEWDDEAAIRAMARKIIVMMREVEPPSRGLTEFRQVASTKLTRKKRDGEGTSPFLEQLTNLVATHAKQHLPALADEIDFLREQGRGVAPSDAPVQAVVPVPDVVALPEILFGD